MCVGVESKLWKAASTTRLEARSGDSRVKYSLKYSDDDALKWPGVDRNRVERERERERDFAKEKLHTSS